MEPCILLLAQMPSIAPLLLYLTVLTLQRSLLGPHWVMHEPSGPLSVLHSSETCTESTRVCSSSFSRECFFVSLCKGRSSELLVAEERSYANTGGKLGRWCSQICQHLVQNHPQRSMMQLTASSMCGNDILTGSWQHFQQNRTLFHNFMCVDSTL